MKHVRDKTTDAEIDAAIARTARRDGYRPIAMRVRYRARDRHFVINFASGVELAIPRELLEGLESASVRDVANVEIVGPGTGLHWPSLDVDHYVPALLDGIFGTKKWMSEIGRHGGRARTPAKTDAARANGRKGGRPRRIEQRIGAA